MDDLKFPVFSKEPVPPAFSNMDECVSFVLWMREIFFDREVYQRRKREEAVNVRFSLQ